MDSVAQLPAADRSELFRAAADAKGVSVQIIEKDFWVCWVLRHLAALHELPPIYFKGGTSLSKAFAVIDRMSEDIDLVIDREALGFSGDRDPMTVTGTNARERLIKEIKLKAAAFVGDELAPTLRTRFAAVLGDQNEWSLAADISNLSNTTISFRYPTAESPSAYLKPMVLLELGARGDTWPAVDRSIRPYAADTHPQLFKDPACIFRTITAQRTFWEKATHLHVLAHGDPAKAGKAKPARHYYDLYRLAQHQLGREAIADRQLLADVVRFKTTFYAQPAAKYDLAVPATLRLVPDEATIKAIRPDYNRMTEEMVFGQAPDFDEVLRVLGSIETILRA